MGATEHVERSTALFRIRLLRGPGSPGRCRVHGDVRGDSEKAAEWEMDGLLPVLCECADASCHEFSRLAVYLGRCGADSFPILMKRERGISLVVERRLRSGGE